MSESTIRCFVAVRLAVPLDALLASLAGCGADLAMVRATDAHVTLAFLGDLAVARIALVEAAMRHAVAEDPPFDLRIERVGSFGDPTAPRVVRCGLDAPALMRIAARLQADLSLRGITYADDYPFSPHLTLARVKSRRRMDALIEWLRLHADDSIAAQRIDTIALLRSRPGQPYETLQVVALPRGS